MTEFNEKKTPKTHEKELQLLRSSPRKSGLVSKLTDDVAVKRQRKIKGDAGEGGVDAAAVLRESVRVGGTNYQRIFCQDESGAFGGGRVSLWTPEGKSTEEGWVEMTLETGDVAYARWGNRDDTRWHLPDVSSAHYHVTVEKEVFSLKKEWSGPQRELVSSTAARVFSEYVLSRDGEGDISEMERGKMIQNIANEYMATKDTELYDEGLEKWVRRAAAAEIDTLLIGKATGRAMLPQHQQQQQVGALELQQKLGIVGLVSREAVKKTVSARLEQRKQQRGGEDKFSVPASPLLPRTRWTHNPHYVSLLDSPSPRRGCMEPRLEATIFATPGAGEVRVLCAMGVCEGYRGPQQHLFAVARDWTGAFCFFILEPFTDVSEATILAVYPLLGEFDMLPTSHQKVLFRVDKVEFVASFKDMEHVQWFHDAMMAALASMYGEGNDSERIVKMRAYSVEFAGHYTPKRPLGAFEVAHKILSGSDHASALVNDNITELRSCLGAPQGRDTVARLWLRSVEGIFVYGEASHSIDLVNNHLQVMEELIRCPTPYMDLSIPPRLQGRLEEMGEEFPEFRERCSRTGVLLDYTDRAMQKWSPRAETPDVPWEPCFNPVCPSQAAQYESSILEERRLRGVACRRSPGIYLAVLCFCGSRVFTDAAGNLIAEVIRQEPTRAELQQLTPDSEDYQWLLRLGGADRNWAEDKLQDWIKVYEKRGMETFKARFVRAASRLWQTGIFPTLGCIFDTPILQDELGSALVLTICELESEEFVSPNAGVWREARDLESFLYRESLMCRVGARVAFLPSGYRQCVRYVDAAMQYQRSLTHRLSPGFYLGFFLFSMGIDGALMLVPECNRNLPPLVKVSDELPSLLHWRWLQSLNYRHQTTGTFGLPIPMDLAIPPDESGPFEGKVGHAVATLEAAVGFRVQKFYDLDLFALDEQQTIYAFFAVAYHPPPLHGFNGSCTPEASKGLVPMTFKLVRVVDHHHQRRYWGTVYSYLGSEKDLAYRRICCTTQPFTSDEAIRLHPEKEVMLYAMDMDKYALLWSWARTLAIWGEADGMTLVQKHAGQLLKKVTMGESEHHSASFSTIDELVDIAVANQAAATDPNLFELKSLLLQLLSGGKHEWDSVLQRLRAKDDMMIRGYADSVVLTQSKDGEAPLPLRSFDDVPLDERLYCAPRPVTVYELPCTLMEFISGEDNLTEAYLFASEIVDDIIEMAASGGAVAVVGRVAETMVSCVEAAEDMVDGAALEVVRTEVEEMAWMERQTFLKRWGAMFNTSRSLSAFDEGFNTSAEAQEPIFHAGSQDYIESATDGLRVCLARAASDANQMQELLRMANSALHCLELAQSIHAYSEILEEREKFLVHHNTDKNKRQIKLDKEVPKVETLRRQSPLVTLVSREQREVPLYSLDPLRCLVLQGDRVRVSLPEFSYIELSEFGDHMNASEQDVALQLRDFNPPIEAWKRMLDMAIQLQAPLLAIRLFVLVYCPSTGRFGDEMANTVRMRVTMPAGSFFFQYGVRDWLQMEALGGHAVIAGFDVLWWLRYLKEASEGGEEEAYSSYSSSWKQVYAETRVRMLLSLGVDRLAEEEVALWMEELGRHVAYMSFKELGHITDAEVSLLAVSCPLLQSLDLSGTAVTDQSARLLGAKCKHLVECSVVGTRVSRRAAEELNDICRRNAPDSMRT